MRKSLGYRTFGAELSALRGSAQKTLARQRPRSWGLYSGDLVNLRGCLTHPVGHGGPSMRHRAVVDRIEACGAEAGVPPYFSLDLSVLPVDFPPHERLSFPV